MTEKIQMTEEQAIEIIQCVYDTKSRDFNYALERLKEKGYIRKSELETLVEEAEEMYKGCEERINKTEPRDIFNDVIIRQHNAIQAFKTKYPEFNK